MATELEQNGEISEIENTNAIDPTENLVFEVKENGSEGPEEMKPSSNEGEKSISESADGNRTFTMRELLNELDDVSRDSDGNALYRQESLRQKDITENDISMDLINHINGVDAEGRSRQKVLSFAAQRYASAIERNPSDHDAFYNWALVLQESADNIPHDSTSPSKDALLEEACKKYDKATQICPSLHDAFYNWAIAISDRAKLHGRTKEAEKLWKQATRKYEKSVQLNWNNPQALNNWGLALQELSAIVPVREKPNIIKTAIGKFRAAIQLQFDFHRAIYNLGTVLYGLAEDTLRSGRPVSVNDISPDELYSQSAIYIASAHALKPAYSVYTSALRLVRSMLPLPYLKTGYLIAAPLSNPLAPHSDWERSQFVLNQEGFQQVDKTEEQKQLNHSPSYVDKSLIKVDIPDIISISACADLTLPPGAGMCIDTVHGPIYLVAETWELVDCWLDAIRLVYTIHARGKSDVLAGIVTGSLRNGALVHFVDRFPNSDLGSAKEGQIVKVTGFVSCENHSLESSYERVSRCVYTSTLLYECGGFQSKPISNFKFKRNLVHIERSVVDLYVTDAKSGLRVTVKAGYGSEVIPLINESTLVNTSSKNMILSSTLIKWLGERDLTADARMLCLEEGYVKEGSSLTVMGMLTRHDGILMIVPPPEFISTGCFVQKLLFPMEINGITLSTPNNVNSTFSNVRPPQFC